MNALNLMCVYVCVCVSEETNQSLCGPLQEVPHEEECSYQACGSIYLYRFINLKLILGFSADLCRKDIYEKDKKEYWAHVSTSGKFIRINEKTHTHEYEGEEAANQARKAAKSSKGEPKVMLSDDESSDSDSEGSSSCCSVQPKTSERKRESSSEKKPKKKSKKSPKHTPKSRKGKSKKLKKSGRKQAKKSPKHKDKKHKKAEEEVSMEDCLHLLSDRCSHAQCTSMHNDCRTLKMSPHSSRPFSTP